MLASPHPTRLTVLRVQLNPTAAQRPLLENLFALQQRISQLLASHGIHEVTERGASQFLLRHLTGIKQELTDASNASMDQLIASVLEMASATHDVLRRAVPGSVCVARDMVSLPIRTLGPVKIGSQLEEIAKTARSHCLIENNCVLFYGNGQFEVELQWWRPSKRVADPSPGAQVTLRNAISKPTATARNGLPLQPPRTEKSTPARAKRQNKQGKTRNKAPAPTKEEIAKPEKVQQLRSWTFSNPEVPNSILVRRRGKVSARRGPWAIGGKRMPPLNFATSSNLTPMITVDCSCLGNNASCYRCDGRGYYEQAGAVTSSHSLSTPTPQVRSIVRYENDQRGGEYAVRENGRFLSNPLHDTYDDESDA